MKLCFSEINIAVGRYDILDLSKYLPSPNWSKFINKIIIGKELKYFVLRKQLITTYLLMIDKNRNWFYLNTNSKKSSFILSLKETNGKSFHFPQS